MSDSYTIERDLKEAEAMVKALDNYVRQDTLYGSVSGGFFSFSKMPALTIGAVVMRLRRLDVLHDGLNADQRTRLDKTVADHKTVYDAWRVHYDAKMLREAHSRLDAMRTFFEECANSPALCPRIYGPEALRRTVVQEIMLAMEANGTEIEKELKEKAQGVDGRLHAVVKHADFYWDAGLEPAYPRHVFWWLYHRPIAPGS